MFLSNVMCLSNTWEVTHEPAGPRDQWLSITEIQKRLNRDHYGEVNSWLCFKARQLSVHKLGVIFRDPAEVWISIANRKPRKQWHRQLALLRGSYHELVQLVEQQAIAISFRRMTTDINYLHSLLEQFGIVDVEISPNLLTNKINATRNPTYDTIFDFDDSIAQQIEETRSIIQEYIE